MTKLFKCFYDFPLKKPQTYLLFCDFLFSKTDNYESN